MALIQPRAVSSWMVPWFRNILQKPLKLDQTLLLQKVVISLITNPVAVAYVSEASTEIPSTPRGRWCPLHQPPKTQLPSWCPRLTQRFITMVLMMHLCWESSHPTNRMPSCPAMEPAKAPFSITSIALVKVANMGQCFWWKQWWNTTQTTVKRKSEVGFAFAADSNRHDAAVPPWQTGPRLNIKTVLSTYGDFHVKDKTAVRTSYL